MQDINRGHIDIGAMYVVVLIFVAGMIAFVVAGGKLPTALPDSNPAGRTFVNVVIPTPQQAKGSLQLYNFQGVTVTPNPSATNSAN